MPRIQSPRAGCSPGRRRALLAGLQAVHPGRLRRADHRRAPLGLLVGLIRPAPGKRSLSRWESDPRGIHACLISGIREHFSNSSGSWRYWPSVPSLTHSPVTRASSPGCLPSAKAIDSRSGSTPSSPASRCPGVLVLSNGTSTASDAQASDVRPTAPMAAFRGCQGRLLPGPPSSPAAVHGR